MSVRVCYVDESQDRENFVLSALTVDGLRWKECFEHVKRHRKHLKDHYGIRLSREIHSHELVRGKGRSLFTRILGKWDRSQVFRSLLGCIAAMPTVQVFNVCLKVRGRRDPQMDAWDRLLNRIESFCKKSEDQKKSSARTLLWRLQQANVPEELIEHAKGLFEDLQCRAIIVSDEGREKEIESALRRMHVHNYIPSRFGRWEDGNRSKNITTDRIIEDPVFKQSHRSYFIQLADCASYALLKRESAPTPVVAKYDIDKMWDPSIGKVCVTAASRKDEFGIVRK